MWLSNILLRPLAWRVTISILLAVVLGTYLVCDEMASAQMLALTGGATLGLAGLLLVLSKRVFFSVGLTAALVAAVVAISLAKFHFMSVSLHSYDIVFYLTSKPTVIFLIDNFLPEFAGLIALLAAIAILAIAAYRHDALQVPRWTGLAVVALAAVLVGLNHESGRPSAFSYFKGTYPLSVFYDSFRATATMLMRGELFEAAAATAAPPFQKAETCAPPAKLPHILLIHQESMIPFKFFPSQVYDPAQDSLFTSGDGKIHKLRVETHGGASWLTEFSIFSGVSSMSFGNMSLFVQALMRNRVHEVVPQVLANCGYRTAVFYPLDRNFVGNGPFYTSIGMHKIFDRAAQGLKAYVQRDNVYYKNALDYIGQSLSEARTPLFVFLLTSSGHQPYTSALSPETNVQSRAPGSDPIINEYLRRQSMARIDFETFRAELKTRFPHESFLIVQYGDHQPYFTRQFPEISYKSDNEAGNEVSNMLSYYAVEGINFTPPPLPAAEIVDVPYLGTIMLHLAGVPLPPSYEERLRLMGVCNGAYAGCRRRELILSFHRRLIDSGIITPR